MPTMPERMATVETKVSAIDSRTANTDHKVDLLVSWMHEQRGVKKERERTQRRDRAILGIVASLFGALGSALFSAVNGGQP